MIVKIILARFKTLVDILEITLTALEALYCYIYQTIMVQC